MKISPYAAAQVVQEVTGADLRRLRIVLITGGELGTQTTSRRGAGRATAAPLGGADAQPTMRTSAKLQTAMRQVAGPCQPEGLM